MSSLPPERVNIKRKRDAESVDILLIRDEQRPEGKRPRFVFQKVSPEVHPNIFAKPPQARTSANVASKEIQYGLSKTQAPNARNLKLAPQSSSSHKDAARVDSSSKISAPREFRLNRPLNSGVSKHGRATSPNKKLATFREIRAAKKSQIEPKLASVLDHPLPTSDTLPTPKQLQLPRQRIKPRQSAADLAWRASSRAEANSRSSSVAPSRTAGAETDADLGLAQSLAAFALEATTPTRPTSPPAKKSPLKFQPKPAPTRGRQAQKTQSQKATSNLAGGPIDIDMDDDNHLSESESDYEYDTYVRVAVDAGSTDSDMDWEANGVKFTDMTHGVLVIEDEDEELWATYAMDDEQGPEFDTDEDDEDAEDYYKNEYPEEEVDSEDEYGRGAYDFRQGGSDDEHYGNGEDEDEAGWSDGEGRPKGLIGSQASGHWIHEFASPVQHRGLDPY